MPLFSVNRGKTALSITNDLLTIVASGSKPLRIWMCKLAGAGAAPADNEVLLQRSTGGTTPGGPIAPEKVDPNSNGASFSVYTTWSAQPTLSGGPLHRFEANANGGIDPFVALPGGEFKVPVSTQVSIRAANGSSPAIVNMLVEECD